MSKADSSDEQWLLPKPQEKLHFLPPQWQWEVTRRHPYYLQFWKEASEYRQQLNPSAEVAEKGFLAQTAISLIGLYSDYAPPTTPFEELELEKVSKVWHRGSIFRIPYVGMLHILLHELGPEDCDFVSDLFAARNDERLPESLFENLGDIVKPPRRIRGQVGGPSRAS